MIISLNDKPNFAIQHRSFPVATPQLGFVVRQRGGHCATESPDRLPTLWWSALSRAASWEGGAPRSGFAPTTVGLHRGELTVQRLDHF
jgi:hypothetical protein